MYSIGERLKRLRIQKNLTQEELGERTDLSKGYISQVERDLASPSMETFFNILEVLGCAPKDFFDKESTSQKVYYSESETLCYVLKGKCKLKLGDEEYIASSNESFYFLATSEHRLSNPFDEVCELLIVATNSYL